MMDIAQWPTESIMQLPDFCFGERYLIGSGARLTESAGTVFTMSSLPLPELAVIWEICAFATGTYTSESHVGIRLGDSIPADVVEYNHLPPLIGSIIGRATWTSTWNIPSFGGVRVTNIRYLVRSTSRHLIFRFQSAAETISLQAMVTVSSVPKAIPSWVARTIVYADRKI